MNIVLIGAGGFLGNALYRVLSKEHHLELFSSTQRNGGDIIHFYKWPECSLGEERYKKILLAADVIIYAAGAGIQPGQSTPDDVLFQLNLFEPVRLVQQLVKEAYSGQLITFGSYFENGMNQAQEPVSEEVFLSTYHPQPNTYCRSKKELSHLHFAHSKAGISFKWLHLVLTNIYGPGENEKRLIPYIIGQSRAGIPLHFTSGTQVRQYTYIQDVAAIVEALLGKGNGIYHVTNETTVSVKTVIEETLKQVQEQYSIQPEVHFDLPERRDTSMDYLAVSAQKLLTDWGLRCPTDLAGGIPTYFL